MCEPIQDPCLERRKRFPHPWHGSRHYGQYIYIYTHTFPKHCLHWGVLTDCLRDTGRGVGRFCAALCLALANFCCYVADWVRVTFITLTPKRALWNLPLSTTDLIGKYIGWYDFRIQLCLWLCFFHDYVFKFLKRFIYDEPRTNILYDSHVLETKNICHRFIINEVFILNPNP